MASSTQAATALRILKQKLQNSHGPDDQSGQRQRDGSYTNKRPRLAASDEHEPLYKKNKAVEISVSTLEHNSIVSHEQEEWSRGEKKQIENTGHEAYNERKDDVVSDTDILTEIAFVAAKNEQLQLSLASLKRKFSIREEEMHQLLLELGVLNSTTNEIAVLQKEYLQRSLWNAALVQDSLVQISNCSAQVDRLKRKRKLTMSHLHSLKHECGQEMHRFVSRLQDLEENMCQEPEPLDEDDDEAIYTSSSMKADIQLFKQSKKEMCELNAPGVDDKYVKNAADYAQQASTERINLALAQFDNLQAEVFQLKQTLVHDNQHSHRHLKNILFQELAHIRAVQDNELHLIFNEMSEIRSGMCGIQKDVHLSKERTKYLVPNIAPSSAQPLRVIGRRSDDRWIDSTAQSSTSQDFYFNCRSMHQPSSRPTNDDDWRAFPPEDAFGTNRHAVHPCERSHYPSRSLSLSDRLCMYGETSEDMVTADQLNQQLVEQHRLFWIGEGAGSFC
ncbi:hypothetical protein PsorP6_006309 [Peronosclerospora sorghi]|uniref:Uncharacterized protein n=1 Tax=Peronosclerospora sorghi TaxID=230839 RepID=A0ACC0W519_9STRA|nr:hypothetical protein PsorP6_006309 [Peronosclerospora sorghi]